MYIEKINEPKNLKKIEIEDLDILAKEVRDAIINRVSKIGGHIGPNLGVVELTIALHYVFNSPVDKIVFDVSHQSYAHKILTGRREAFTDDKMFSKASGFTNPLESEHDMFAVGHTSTSISLALGLAKGRDLNNKNENVIAVIGDGSLSGGEALEGLDYAGEYNKNLIIIVNDNDQSIAENHGGIYKSLADLRKTNGTSTNNIFKAFGLDYRYLDNGHDIRALIELLNDVKDINHPIVIHIHTIKGKGLAYAEKYREKYHQGTPFNIVDGTPKNISDTTYITRLRDSLVEFLKNNKKGVVLNAATPARLGFSHDIREPFVGSGQFIDVGIAEEHATAMISGIAKNGGTPVFGTLAAFLQRIYDQLSHDLCLNDNPAVILTLLAGVYGLTSNTHIALCDIQMFAHIPNLIYIAPATYEEYINAFNYATTQKAHPIMIRVPVLLKNGGIDNTDYSKTNKFKVCVKGSDVAIIAVGNMYFIAQEIVNRIKEETGKSITLINPMFLTGIDKEALDELSLNHNTVITIEDGELDGGYGERIAQYYGDSNMKVKCYGISKKFHTGFNAEELLKDNGISVDNITNYIYNIIN